TCSGSGGVICGTATAAVETISADVVNAAGGPLVIVWSLNGTSIQTNNVPASGPPTTAHVELTTFFSPGRNAVTASASDTNGCIASCSTSVTLLNQPTITCPAPITNNCAPASGAIETISVFVTDTNTSRFTVVWTVD